MRKYWINVLTARFSGGIVIFRQFVTSLILQIVIMNENVKTESLLLTLMP